MTVGNLAVCFGPTLLRPEEETVASIMDIKFYNIVVEILIENCERIIAGPPQDSSRITAVQATVVPNKSQCVKVEEGPTSSGNGTAFLRYPLHTAVAVTPATSSHAHVSFNHLIYSGCLTYCLEKYRKLDFLEISCILEKIQEFLTLLENSKNLLKNSL